MRVIYTPKDEKEIECPNCGSILGYNEYDIYNGYDELFGELHSIHQKLQSFPFQYQV